MPAFAERLQRELQLRVTVLQSKRDVAEYVRDEVRGGDAGSILRADGAGATL